MLKKATLLFNSSRRELNSVFSTLAKLYKNLEIMKIFLLFFMCKKSRLQTL